MENLDFILSLFNQYTFADAKSNLEYVRYYVNTNPATSGNTLINSLLGAIQDYSLDAIDVPLFQSILAKDNKTPGEQQKIMNELMRWKSYTKEQMAPTKKYLEEIIAGSIISQATFKYANDPVGYLKQLKQANIKLDKSDAFVTERFDNIDINSIVAGGPGSGFKSHFDWINDLFDPAHCYESGQLGIISMPPGTGKSLFMMTEAVHIALNNPNSKVLYLAMGDLKMKDFVIRMGAIVSGLSFADVSRNLGSIYNTLKQTMGDRLHISVNPSGVVDPEEFVDYVLDNGFNVVMVDYDSNFKIRSMENMYSEYGQVYNQLTRLTQENILVFVGCQPHKNTWNNDQEVIGMGDLGESSRKPHYADFIFTASKFKGPNHCGLFHVGKNRRGEEGNTIGYIRLGNGRFRLIPEDIARQLSNPPKAYYTDADIDKMIQDYNTNLQSMNTAGMSFSGPSKAGKIKNPFKP